MKKRTRIIFFGFIAFLMLSELITSNLYSLLGPLEATAEIMGVSVAVERLRLIILIVLDAVPGIGALLAIYGYRRMDAIRAGQFGVIMTTFGMLAYGGYQFLSATFQLGNMQGFVKLVGVVYALLGLAAWLIGSDLRKGRLSPDTSTQALG
jgi:hypothetical protein